MPYSAPGSRHQAVATKASIHGQVVTEDGFVGTAFKIADPGQYTAPADRDNIAITEAFEIHLPGIHEIPYVAGMDVGDPLWIRSSDNAILQTDTGTNEVQTLTIDATGGTFALTFEGLTTTAIAEAATAATVQAALEALNNVDPGDVTVTGSAGGPYTITWGGQYYKTDVEAIVTDPALLTGGTGTAVITTGTPGVEGLKLGRIEEIDSVREIVRVNADAKDGI